MRRIVFFSKEDLASYHMMGKIDEFFKNKLNEKPIESIDDILERHHIIEYIENGFTYQDWTGKEVDLYKGIIKEFKKDISQYFKNLNTNDILNFYDDIHFNYFETFWLLINKHGTFEQITSSELDSIFKKKRFRISDILYCKRVVNHFDKEIGEYLVCNPLNAEILLSYFEATHDRPQQEKFFPRSLTLEDREKLIDRYLESDNTNLNYIRLIVKNKDSENLRFTDKTRLKAKRLADKINDELLNSEHALILKKGVALSEDQDEIKKIEYKDGEQIYSYSKKRLSEDINNVTLLKNFRTVFEYLDFQGCINFVPRTSEIDSFEYSFIRSKNEFFISSAFSEKSLDGHMCFEIYKFFLDSMDINLEDVIESFVNEYLNKTYNINYFKLHLPSKESTYLGKIRLIVPEFESLLEQYKLYVEDDIVDYELLQVSTKTSKSSSIPSLLQKKYVYPFGDEYLKLKHTFFSNMSYLIDYEKYGDKYSSFCHLLMNEKISLNDFDDFRKNNIQQLIDENYLKVNENGILEFVNQNLILIVYYLKDYDVISYWRFPKSLREEIDVMSEQKMVKFSDKLLTVAEQEYFDYYLNNRFSNGLWLRNKYVHATNSHNEEEQENDYKTLLKLLVLLILKIEDDLSISKSLIKSNIQ
ncbi:hypothetical protein [Chryseobacterium sp. 'Rf worker isolate 10']|uniref:hypothetical protein n=1 Tax=Chryseobacterium sp. 'Rf worker isolate 10' TaxID=2887348 RepID=UPI003D6E80C2